MSASTYPYVTKKLLDPESSLTVYMPLAAYLVQSPRGVHMVHLPFDGEQVMDHEIVIGPYSRNRVVLCSGDASPNSQRKVPSHARYFYPGAKWVGAVGNAAERLRCRFVILAGPYGLVDPWEVIEPYDVPGYSEEERKMLREKILLTLPRLIGGNRYDLLVLYGGANKREILIDVMGPALRSNGLDLITFGKPNMGDIGKLEPFVNLVITGTTLNGLRSLLSFPDRLLFLPK